MVVTYKLYDSENELFGESDIMEIKNVIACAIAFETRLSAMYELIDSTYDGVEIGGFYYSASSIVESFDDLGDVFASLIMDKIKNIELPNVGETKEYQYSISWDKVTFSISAHD